MGSGNAAIFKRNLSIQMRPESDLHIPSARFIFDGPAQRLSLKLVNVNTIYLLGLLPLNTKLGHEIVHKYIMCNYINTKQSGDQLQPQKKKTPKDTDAV
jgi:hypothetical protein